MRNSETQTTCLELVRELRPQLYRGTRLIVQHAAAASQHHAHAAVTYVVRPVCGLVSCVSIAAVPIRPWMEDAPVHRLSLLCQLQSCRGPSTRTPPMRALQRQPKESPLFGMLHMHVHLHRPSLISNRFTSCKPSSIGTNRAHARMPAASATEGRAIPPDKLWCAIAGIGPRTRATMSPMRPPSSRSSAPQRTSR